MPAATRAFVRPLAAAPFPDGNKHGKEPAYNDPSVLFVVPGHFDPARPFDVVVYLHGWHTAIAKQYGIGEDAKTIWYGLDRQVDKTTRNVLLLAPQLPKDVGDGDPGKLAHEGGVAALLAGARDVLVPQFPEHPAFAAAFDAASLIVVSYSGGFRAAACFVQPAGVPDRVKAVLMLDSLYGKAADFAAWIAAHEASIAFVSLAIEPHDDENTLAPSIALLKKLGHSEKNVLPLPVSPPRLGKVDVYRIQADHHRLPVEGPPDGPLTWFLDSLLEGPATHQTPQTGAELLAAKANTDAADAMSPFRRRLAAIVEEERAFFNGHKESETGKKNKDGTVRIPPGTNYAARVGTYWNVLDKSHTGEDDIAWSAAFVSWAMKSAGAEGDFPYHQRHGNYIHAAIANKRANKLSAPIVGYRTADRVPRVGDLIGKGRGTTADMTYDRAAKTMKYESHVDVVVEVGDGVLYAVGGNVGQTVARTKVALDAKGRIRNPDANHWFVVIAVNL